MDDRLLLAKLDEEREHVIRAVSGVSEQAMRLSPVPSGWTMTRMLNHLAFDDEMFWISAVVGGKEDAIAALHDGWASDEMTGEQAIRAYRDAIAASDEILGGTELDAPVRWWPSADDFGGPVMSSCREVVFRVLVETSTHAGHLDIARELIDGHQHLVVP